MTKGTDDKDLVVWLRGFSPSAPRAGEREKIGQAADRIEQLSSGGKLHERILIALGGMRDDMTDDDVKAVQRFVSALQSLQVGGE
jgi:hypothetical protein